MQFKTIEDLWTEIGWQPDKENFKGYIIHHFEEIYLGVREIVCVNINIFENIIEGINFLDKCCEAFDCKPIWRNVGEYWIVHKNNNKNYGYIPSRFNEDKDSHRRRGNLLGYPSKVIENYFIE